MAKKFSDPNLFTKTWKKEGALTKNDPSENLTKDCETVLEEFYHFSRYIPCHLAWLENQRQFQPPRHDITHASPWPNIIENIKKLNLNEYLEDSEDLPSDSSA